MKKTRSLKSSTFRGKNGFTLIEVLVSVGLFVIVMMVSLTVILSVVDGNKKSQAINTVVNNLNSSIDSMVRDMKTGTNYQCAAVLTAGGSPALTLPSVLKSSSSGCVSSTATGAINFVSTITGSERSVRYEYVAQVGSTPGYIAKEVCTTSCTGTRTSITSSEINITDMRMYVKSPAAGSQSQPGIFIIISGTAKINATTVSDFHLQTYVSQRILNI